MKKEKVLIVHNYYQIPGGEDTVVANEKKMLEDNGHEVLMYTRHNNEIKKVGFCGKVKFLMESIYSFRTASDIRKVIKSKKIDLVHVHNTFPLISPSVYKASKMSGAKVFQTIHNFRLLCPAATFVRDEKICEECVSRGLMSSVKHSCYRNSKLQTLITALMLKINRAIGSYNYVDRFIALTDFNKEKLSFLIDKDKISVKPNFVEVSNLTYRTDLGEYYLFLGRIDELKGIKLLVSAWKNVDSKLLIVGKGPLDSYIEEYINANNLNNIKLLGFKRKNEVEKILSKAKALIVPSQWYEGFPMTIVEALSFGIPVIASDIGNLSFIIDNYKNGLLFNSSSIEDLVLKVKLLNENTQLLRDLSAGARKTFMQKYNDSVNYSSLIIIYNT